MYWPLRLGHGELPFAHTGRNSFDRCPALVQPLMEQHLTREKLHELGWSMPMSELVNASVSSDVGLGIRFHEISEILGPSGERYPSAC